MGSTIRTTQSSSDSSLPNIGASAKAKTSEIFPLIDQHIGNINDTLGKSIVSGFLSWGDSGNYYSITNGNQFNLLRSGSGKIKNKSVSWLAGQFVLLTPSKTAHIYINENGIIGKVDNDSMNESVYQNNIVLFQALYDGTNFIITKANHSYEFPVQVAGYIRSNIGTIVEGIGANIAKLTSGTGGVVTDRQIKLVGADSLVSAGLLTVIPDSNALPISINYMFKNSSGKWGRYAYQDSVPMVYNNAGTITVLSNGTTNSVSVVSLYVSKDDLNTSNPKYIGCIHNGTFNTVADAIDAIQAGSVVVSDNELAFLDLCSLGYMVIKNNTSNGYIDSVIIAKDTVNARKVGGGSGNSHLTLADLNKGQFGDGGHDNLSVMKVTASTDPTVNDDGQYFKEGSFWLNKETGITYVLVSGTVGAADWRVSGGSGSGSPSIFAILQADYDKLTWTQGNNAIFLGSGTATATFAKNATDVVLNGKYSYKWTLGSVNDWLCSGDISVPKRHQGRTIKVDFPFLYNGMSSDIKLQFWDATNNALIPLETTYIQATNGVSGTTAAVINIPATCLNMRVGFHNLSANSGKILYFDDVVFDGDYLKTFSYQDEAYARYSLNSTYNITSTLEDSGISRMLTLTKPSSNTQMFTAKKKVRIDVSAFIASTNSAGPAAAATITKNGTTVVSQYDYNYQGNFTQYTNPSAPIDLDVGEYVSINFYFAYTFAGAGIAIRTTEKQSTIQSSYSPNDLIGEVVRIPRNVCPSGFIPAMGTSIGLSSGTYQGGAYYDLYKVLWEMSGIACASSSVYTNVNITTNRFSPDQASHSFVTGTPVQITTTGSLPGGLSLATIYYIYVISSTSYCLATTFDNAINGIVIDITSQGTGTHTVSVMNDGAVPYVLNGIKGSSALADWNAGKQIYINESGLFERVYLSGKTNEVGAKQFDAFQGHWHELFVPTAATGASQRIYPSTTSSGRISSGTVENPISDGANGTPRTSAETRPVSVAKYAFIRYGNAQPTTLLLPNAAQTEYYIEAAGNGGQAITAAQTDIPFIQSLQKNLFWDGSGFTAPIDGVYDVSGMVAYTSSASIAIYFYINGVSKYQISTNIAGFTRAPFGRPIYLYAGQRLSLRSDVSVTLQNGSYHNLTITRLNGKNDSVCVGNVAKNQRAIIQYKGNGARTTVTSSVVSMPLSLIKGDSSIVSILNNQFTLAQGSYDVDCFAYTSHADAIGWLFSYLYNVTDSIEVERSLPTTGSTSGDAGIEALSTTLELTSTKVFEWRFVGPTGTHYIGHNNASPNDLNGYIKIKKLNGN